MVQLLRASKTKKKTKAVATVVVVHIVKIVNLKKKNNKKKHRQKRTMLFLYFYIAKIQFLWQNIKNCTFEDDMIYKQFKDKKLSLLGFGAMRLPTFEKNDQIDVEKASLMVQKAIDLGINYFDTAWGYHGGQSEIVMGEILSKFDRERFYLASKFPGYDLSTFEKKEEVFSKQLEKCKVEYFDF